MYATIVSSIFPIIMYFCVALTAYTLGATPSAAAVFCSSASFMIEPEDLVAENNLIAYSLPEAPRAMNVVPSLPLFPLILYDLSICVRVNLDNLTMSAIYCIWIRPLYICLFLIRRVDTLFKSHFVTPELF